MRIPNAVTCERRLMADLRRPALGTSDPKPASQNVVLNVSKVAMSASAGAPGIGQKKSMRPRFENSHTRRGLSYFHVSLLSNHFRNGKASISSS